MKSRSYLYGVKSEILVRNYFESKEFKCLGNRVKTPFGELDLIVKKENLIVFAEVKARKNLKHFEIITNRQIIRNSEAANFYLSNNQIFDKYDTRFDLIVVIGNIIREHIENAWEYTPTT